MMDAGLSGSAGLFQRGDLHEDLPAIRSVGYRQLWQYLQGNAVLDEAVEKVLLPLGSWPKGRLPG